MNILALDVGLKKIGVALGSSLTGSARPLGLVLQPQHLTKILSFVKSWQIQKIVVGHPGHYENNEPLLAYIEDLKKQLLLAKSDLIFIDWTEEGSSQEAAQWQKQITKKSYSKDELAAVLILESYFYHSASF